MTDYFSKFTEIAYLTSTSSAAVIEHCKSIFSRHGIPETLVSDNGPQFASREFAAFSRKYDFQHVTSSPRYPQANGEAERQIQTVKNILKKSADPYLGILNFRATPLQCGFSPAERLMGRKLRTLVPSLTSKRIPDWPRYEDMKESSEVLKAKQKANHDTSHRARPLPPFQPGDKVWIKTPKDHTGTIQQEMSPRSYLVKTEQGLQRRNRRQMTKRQDVPQEAVTQHHRATSTIPPPQPERREPLTPSIIEEEEGNDTDNPIRQTRSGRKIIPPDRLDL